MDDAARAQIRRLLETGLTTEQVARELGVPKGTVSAVKAHVTMGSYGASPSGAGSLSEADVEELEDAADLKFGLERDLQDALRRNIHQLDPTLRIVDHGKERRVEAGFIDILAEDDQDSLVVIELKSGEAPETAVTQLLSYIGSLHTEGSQPVRGILIARGFPKRVRLAAPGCRYSTRRVRIQLLIHDCRDRHRRARTVVVAAPMLSQRWIVISAWWRPRISARRALNSSSPTSTRRTNEASTATASVLHVRGTPFTSCY